MGNCAAASSSNAASSAAGKGGSSPSNGTTIRDAFAHHPERFALDKPYFVGQKALLADNPIPEPPAAFAWTPEEAPLKETCLIAEHEKLVSSKHLVPFAGWRMPVHSTGIKKEHAIVRESAGLFDVSHMGKLVVIGPGAVAALNALLANDLDRIGAGQAQYSMLLDESGGVVDDLIVYRVADDEVRIVPNAANAAAGQIQLDVIGPIIDLRQGDEQPIPIPESCPSCGDPVTVVIARINARTFALAVTAALLSQLAASADYYTEPQVYSSRPDPSRERKLGHVGVTGLTVKIDKWTYYYWYGYMYVYVPVVGIDSAEMKTVSGIHVRDSVIDIDVTYYSVDHSNSYSYGYTYAYIFTGRDKYLDFAAKHGKGFVIEIDLTVCALPQLIPDGKAGINALDNRV